MPSAYLAEPLRAFFAKLQQDATGIQGTTPCVLLSPVTLAEESTLPSHEATRYRPMPPTHPAVRCSTSAAMLQRPSVASHGRSAALPTATGEPSPT